MVGGSSRIPKVRAIVSSFFNGKELTTDINPDEAVAAGAAYLAAVLGGDEELEEVLLFDINPLSLGTDFANGSMAFLIPRNARIPAKVTKVFTTNADNQMSLHIGVYEGEEDLVKDDHLIDEFTLIGIEAARKGKPRIAVTFEINVNGILSVTAEDRKSGVKQVLNVDCGKQRLSGEELENAKRRAEEIELEREKCRTATKAKNDLENYLREMKKRVTSGDVTLSAGDREIALQIVNNGLGWVEDNSQESAEAYEAMKAICKEGLNALLVGDEL
jgi:molecular chaperone DnaK (HSP70)